MDTVLKGLRNIFWKDVFDAYSSLVEKIPIQNTDDFLELPIVNNCKF